MDEDKNADQIILCAYHVKSRGSSRLLKTFTWTKSLVVELIRGPGNIPLMVMTWRNRHHRVNLSEEPETSKIWKRKLCDVLHTGWSTDKGLIVVSAATSHSRKMSMPLAPAMKIASNAAHRISKLCLPAKAIENCEVQCVITLSF